MLLYVSQYHMYSIILSYHGYRAKFEWGDSRVKTNCKCQQESLREYGTECQQESVQVQYRTVPYGTVIDGPVPYVRMAIVGPYGISWTYKK
jgi:hypothetical protein